MGQPGALSEGPKRSRQPNAGSFAKGRSGNPKGRPRGTGKHAGKGASPYKVLLNKTVTTTIRGKLREMSIEEAVQHRTFKDALAGKPKAIREVLAWIKEREDWLKQHAPAPPSHPRITRQFSPDPDNADAALVLLGLARIDRYRARWGLARTPLIIEPWAVELALGRSRGGAGFSQSDWNAIKRCTRDFEILMSAKALSQGDADGPS
ncbi:hypothetical protein EOW77_0011250 [Bradyrhizobium yuanmingense]|nr:hypothetical protein EOW77_0011250 [Bradyrhizobium yuanmingense]